MSSFYGADLAYIHHTGFTALAQHAGERVLEALKAAGIGSGLIVDLGCGSGAWASMAGSAGFSVLGIDVSESMLCLARQSAPGADFRRCSLYAADIPPCVAVTAFGEVLNYGAPDRPSPGMVASLFRRISASLTGGGLFVFDCLVGPDAAPMRYRSWSAGEDYAVLVDAHEDVPQSVLHRDIVVFKSTGEVYRRSEERHVLAVFDSSAIDALLSSAGFLSSSAGTYGNFQLPERRTAFFARRRSAE